MLGLNKSEGRVFRYAFVGHLVLAFSLFVFGLFPSCEKDPEVVHVFELSAATPSPQPAPIVPKVEATPPPVKKPAPIPTPTPLPPKPVTQPPPPKPVVQPARPKPKPRQGRNRLHLRSLKPSLLINLGSKTKLPNPNQLSRSLWFRHQGFLLTQVISNFRRSNYPRRIPHLLRFLLVR